MKTAVLTLVLVPGLVFASSPVKTDDTEKSSQVEQTTPAPAPAPAAAPAGSPAPASPAAPAGTVAGAPAPAAGPANSSVLASNPEEAAKLSGLQIGIDLDHYLGTGTFVNPNYYSYLAANLSISPRYSFNVKGIRLAATGSVRASYEYTLPDSENGRRLSPADIRVGLAAPALYKNTLTGIAVTPSFGATIPVTLESWNASLITNLSLGVGLTRTIGKFDFSANIGGSRGIHASVINAQRPNGRDSQGNLLAICRAGESICGSNGTNTAWSFSTGANVNFRPTDELSITVGYSFGKSWRYDIVPDGSAEQSKAVDSNGRPVVREGLGQVDRSVGFVQIAYQVNDHYGVSFSSFTVQAPLAPDGSVRFPFWSFANVATNATSFTLSLSAAY